MTFILVWQATSPSCSPVGVGDANPSLAGNLEEASRKVRQGRKGRWAIPTIVQRGKRFENCSSVSQFADRHFAALA